MTSELITNAVLHAHTPIELRVHLRSHAIRIEVLDENPRPPVRRHAAEDATYGRGLGLVDTLASRWGVDHIEEDGKAVWFELPTAG